MAVNAGKGKIKILIIEDNPGDAEFIRFILESQRETVYELVHSMNLQTGKERLKEIRFDIVLLDLGLPDSMGLDTLQKVNSEPKDIPIIILTGLEDSQIGTKAVQMGAQDYLVKGNFDDNLLIRAINYAIERKKTEQQLRESEEKFRVIFEQAAIGISQISLDGKYINTNQKLCEILGYSRDELLAMNIQDLTHPDDLKEELRLRGDIIEGKKQSASLEKRYIKKDGSLVWINLTLSLIKGRTRKHDYLISIIEDISARKRAETLLKETTERLSTVFREIPSAVIISTLDDGRYIEVNTAFESITGFSRAEVIGRTSVELGILDTVIKDRIRTEVGEHGSIRNFEINIKRKSGRNITGLYAGRAINVNGLPALLSIITDVTDRRKAIEQIQAYVEELHKNKAVLENNAKELSELNFSLKELNASKDKLFSIVAHDLRSPFSALLGFSEFLSQNLDELSTEEIKEFSGRIYSSLKNVFKLVENLLDWSRLQTGRLEFNPVRFDLDGIINDVIEIYHVSAVRKNVTLNYEGRGEELMIIADRDSIHAVLRNLLNNALKFSNQGGKIEIKTRTNHKDVEVSVTDSGIGINNEDLQKLFQIDTNYSREGTAKEKGTGLGLILCKEFIERNGGRIWAESEEGKGSRFTFTVPVNPDK